MGKVLTGGPNPPPPQAHSDVECSHSGKIATTPMGLLTIKGDPVLVKADVLAGSAFLGCTNTVNPEVPCTAVTSVTAGEATKLFVGGAAAILDSLAGKTNSTPTPGDLQVTAANDDLVTAT